MNFCCWNHTSRPWCWFRCPSKLPQQTQCPHCGPRKWQSSRGHLLAPTPASAHTHGTLLPWCPLCRSVATAPALDHGAAPGPPPSTQRPACPSEGQGSRAAPRLPSLARRPRRQQDVTGGWGDRQRSPNHPLSPRPTMDSGKVSGKWLTLYPHCPTALSPSSSQGGSLTSKPLQHFTSHHSPQTPGSLGGGLHRAGGPPLCHLLSASEFPPVPSGSLSPREAQPRTGLLGIYPEELKAYFPTETCRECFW